MRKLAFIQISLLLVVLCFLNIKSFAQPSKNMQQMPEGTVLGKVVDAASGKPIEAVAIQLLQNKLDSATKKMIPAPVNGAITNAKGEFKMSGIKLMGQYQIEITGIGYKLYETKFSFVDPAKMKNMSGGGSMGDMSAMAGMLEKDLGNIKLAIDNKQLEGVTVSATASKSILAIDRKIFSVDKDLVAAGGSAVDALKNIPAVSVDIDGNLTVRNGSPIIFVDGRPTNLTLDQIPADQIETIEVITNPSAKFDASSGSAGIVNIVLKKAKRVGYNGNLRAGVDQRGKLNGGLNANLRQGKFNIFANGHYNQRQSPNIGTSLRNTFLSSDSTIKLLQNDNSTNKGTFRFGKVGVDYFMDNRNTFTLSGMLMQGNFMNNGNSEINVDSVFNGVTKHAKILRNSFSDGRFRNGGGSLGFVHNFPANGHQISTDLNISKSNSNFKNKVNNSNNTSSQDPFFGNFNQLQESISNTNRLTAQVDYTNPITDKSKIELGARLNQTIMDNDAKYFALTGNIQNQLFPLSSAFGYTDRVWAAYATYTSAIGENFGYQVGLRAENSSYDGDVTKYQTNASSTSGYSLVKSNFAINYPISLFPSVFLSQKLKGEQEFQINYSRKINRPGFFQLFPNVDYSDALNLNRGNPNLKPEFVSSFELSYSKNFNKQNNFIASAYYKLTNDLITRYQTTESNPITGKPVLISSYINANSSYVTGLELITKNTLTNWWDITGNVNIYTSKIKIDDPSIQTAKPIPSWFGKLVTNFKLQKTLSLQFTGDYTSKTVLSAGGRSSGGGGGGRGPWMSVSGNAQGYTDPTYGVDAALKYDFIKNASLTLSVNDIFKTRISDMYQESIYYNQRDTRVRDQQFFKLSFNWTFGKFDTSLFKRKKMNGDDGMQGGMQGGGMQGGM